MKQAPVMVAPQIPLALGRKGSLPCRKYLSIPCCLSSMGGSHALGNRQLKELRRKSQELARQKKLVATQVGKNGATDAFVENLQLALEANKFVKVQAGGCDMEVEDLLAVLEEKTNSICVHKIGHTVTFYKESISDSDGRKV